MLSTPTVETIVLLDMKTNPVLRGRWPNEKEIMLQDRQWWEHLQRSCFHEMQGGPVKGLVDVCSGIFLSAIYSFAWQPMAMMEENCITSKKGMGPIEYACIAWRKAAINFDASTASRTWPDHQPFGYRRSIGWSGDGNQADGHTH